MKHNEKIKAAQAAKFKAKLSQYGLAVAAENKTGKQFTKDVLAAIRVQRKAKQ